MWRHLANGADWLVETVRKLVRPAVTGWLMALLGHAVTHPEVGPLRVRAVFILALIAMGFWFGERAFAALGLNLNDLLKPRRGGQQPPPSARP